MEFNKGKRFCMAQVVEIQHFPVLLASPCHHCLNDINFGSFTL